METVEFTTAGIVISIAFALAWFLGPAPLLKLVYKELVSGWGDAVKLSLYAGLLSFLITRVIPPSSTILAATSYAAGLLSYALGVKLRLQVPWPDSMRGAVAAWGAVILPAIIIGYQLMLRYGVQPSG